LREGLADLVVHDFVVHRVAIALGHDVHRHLAGTEAVHLDGARELLEARIDFGLDGADRQGQRDLAFELLESFNGHGHDVFLVRGLLRGACIFFYQYRSRTYTRWRDLSGGTLVPPAKLGNPGF